jgi:hypothetical protein
MSGKSSQTTAPPEKIAQAPSVIALDTHVHLYPGADPGRALTAGRDNLANAAWSAGYRPGTLCLILTETTRDDAFGALADGRLEPDGWGICPVPGDGSALRAEHTSVGAPLLVLAGRQIVTAERIEVLALATTERFADGRPVLETLSELRERGIPAVLPWGLGKWTGTRGKTVAGAMGRDAGVMLGDNAGRPRRWPTPPLFRQAVSRGMPVLPGSDPLPLPGAEAGIGEFGCLLEGALDPDRPSADLRARLFALRGQPASIGRRRRLRAVLAEQIALRRHKRGPQAAPGPRNAV